MNHHFRVWFLSEYCNLPLDVIRWVIFPYIGEKYVERFIFYRTLLTRSPTSNNTNLYYGNIITSVIREFYIKMDNLRKKYLNIYHTTNSYTLGFSISNIIVTIENMWPDSYAELEIILNVINTLVKEGLFKESDRCKIVVDYIEYNKKEYDILCKTLPDLRFVSESYHVDVKKMEDILCDDRFIAIIDKL